MKLQEIRHNKGLSQAEFAKKAGVSVGAIRHYEQGTRDINCTTIEILIKLAKAADCKIVDLLTNEYLADEFEKYCK